MTVMYKTIPLLPKLLLVLVLITETEKQTEHCVIKIVFMILYAEVFICRNSKCRSNIAVVHVI